MNLLLNNETTVVTTTDSVLKISSTNSGFKVIDENEIQMTTDETEQDVFGIQRIGEINTTSIDLINYEESEE
jgi:uncharacterized protein (DUF1499 family)